MRRLAVISEHGIFHVIVTCDPLHTRAVTGFPMLVYNRVGVTGTGRHQPSSGVEFALQPGVQAIGRDSQSISHFLDRIIQIGDLPHRLRVEFVCITFAANLSPRF